MAPQVTACVWWCQIVTLVSFGFYTHTCMKITVLKLKRGYVGLQEDEFVIGENMD